MEVVVLLDKLNSYNDESFELYRYYKIATTTDYSVESFNNCINSLKDLVNKQYDFKNYIMPNATMFGCNRRDFTQLIDAVCTLLGNKIDEISKCSRIPIITSPSNFEDYCPFPSEDLVLYGKTNCYSVYHDGKQYRVIESKLESTPYYNIYCNTLDRM